LFVEPLDSSVAGGSLRMTNLKIFARGSEVYFLRLSPLPLELIITHKFLSY
jgi:hypothetical protein